MKFCTKCGTQNDDSAQFCGQCGAPLPAPAPYGAQTAAAKPKRKVWPFILAGALALAAIVGCIAYFGITSAQKTAALAKQRVIIAEYQPDNSPVSKAQLDKCTAVLQKRLELMHATQKSIRADYDKGSITVQFQASVEGTDPETVAAKLGEQENLTFQDESGNILMTGDDVASATAKDSKVHLKLTGEGSRKFGEISEKNIGKNISIHLDKEQLMSGRIEEKITDGEFVISGPNISADKAKSLADRITAGPLPFGLHTVSVTATAAKS